jgi:hypothetical protein
LTWNEASDFWGKLTGFFGECKGISNAGHAGNNRPPTIEQGSPWLMI